MVLHLIGYTQSYTQLGVAVAIYLPDMRE